jgi:hypothetical protein
MFGMHKNNHFPVGMAHNLDTIIIIAYSKPV